MSAQTSIEWTDRTWNPTTGCTKVSPGCKHCYAETIAERFWSTQYPPTGDTAHPPQGEVRSRRFTDVWTHPDRLDEPLRWKKPARVFVNSMSDLFHEDVPDEFIAAVFGVMGAAKRHTFQVLTKRPARMAQWLAAVAEKPTGLYVIRKSPALHCAVAAQMQFGNLHGTLNPYHLTTDHVWPLPNVHLGVSVENQDAADERIPLLIGTPASVRFLSIEPLLGPVSLRWMNAWPENAPRTAMNLAAGSTDHLDGLRRLDWVIVGGESGPGARPCELAWIRSIVEQCKAAGVPCFVKQLGANPVRQTEEDALWNIGVSRKGAKMSEWPVDLRVREFPNEDRV
jgi:protein gp37